MQHILLPVAHYYQPQSGECLPACAAMVLRYCGIFVPYARLIKLLGTVPGFGTPSFRITSLANALGVKVHYGPGTLADLYRHLQQNHPPIVFVQTGQLPYWDQDVHHAVLVTGVDGRNIYLNDPAIVQAPLAVPLGDFDLAWLERGELLAILSN